MAFFQVRNAVLEDLPAVRRIFRRSSLSNDGDREVLLANAEVLELPASGVAEGRTRVAVAVDGTVVGFMTTLPPEGSMLELEDLFVDPDWMRRGVARRLITDLIADARRKRIVRAEVTANPHADGFYRSAGFIRLHHTETEFGAGSRMVPVVHEGDA